MPKIVFVYDGPGTSAPCVADARAFFQGLGSDFVDVRTSSLEHAVEGVGRPLVVIPGGHALTMRDTLNQRITTKLNKSVDISDYCGFCAGAYLAFNAFTPTSVDYKNSTPNGYFPLLIDKPWSLGGILPKGAVPPDSEDLTVLGPFQPSLQHAYDWDGYDEKGIRLYPHTLRVTINGNEVPTLYLDGGAIYSQRDEESHPKEEASAASAGGKMKPLWSLAGKYPKEGRNQCIRTLNDNVGKFPDPVFSVAHTVATEQRPGVLLSMTHLEAMSLGPDSQMVKYFSDPPPADAKRPHKPLTQTALSFFKEEKRWKAECQRTREETETLIRQTFGIAKA